MSAPSAVVYIGQNAWGTGPSESTAAVNFRRHGGSTAKGHAVLTFDADTNFIGVDEFGRYHYQGNPPTIDNRP